MTFREVLTVQIEKANNSVSFIPKNSHKQVRKKRKKYFKID